MSIRKLIAGALGALVVTGGIVLPTTAATAAPKAAPNQNAGALSAKVCVPTAGVGVVHPQFPVKPQPVDENVSVYVGGDFTRARGAELEGQLVVNGNALIQGNGIYNLGTVGAGSGIVPVEGSNALRVGGNLTIEAGGRILFSTQSTSGLPAPANARIGGTLADAKLFENQNASNTVSTNVGRTSALGSPSFSDWPNDNFSVLRDIADRNWTGTPGSFTVDSGVLTLTGATGASRHLFEIPASALTNGLTLNLGANIKATDPVIVKVTGTSATLDLIDVQAGGVQVPMGDKRFGQMASQILWTFPTATTVNVTGGQVPGSVVVPTPGSNTTVAAGGVNGRYWVAGNLTQNYGGSEFHAFPFIGEPDMTCGEPPVPQVTQTATPVAPEVVQATCDVDGKTVDPKVTLASTTGIDYTLSKTAPKAGDTVTVTATAKDGYVFPKTVEGWTVAADQKSATKDLTLDEVDCKKPDTVATPVAPEVVQATCDVDGKTVDPKVTLASTTGIDYTLSKTAPKAGDTVTVTATAKDGYVFPKTIEGWTVAADQKSATKSVKLDEVDCKKPDSEVAPVAPEVVQATCDVDGTVVDPKVTLAVTEGVAYELSNKAAKAGDTVTVTATAKDGYVFPKTVEGWTVAADQKSATKSVKLDEVDCKKPDTEVAPVAPEVVQATCDVDGNVVDPKVTLAETAGIDYTVSNKAAKAGDTVTVTATAKDGYVFPKTVEGWTVAADQKSATKDLTLDEVDCTKPDTVAAPVAPEVVQATCNVDGTVVDPKVTLASTTGIDYTLSKTAPKAGDTVTVTATAKDGYVFPETVEGWTVAADQKSATKDLKLDEVDCKKPVVPVDPEKPVNPEKPVTPETPKTPANPAQPKTGEHLAETGGSSILPFVGMGALLLAAGGLLVMRRRAS
ncbi:choice-of-anchor A family protein [Leucobacter iarius]|uniref:Bacterial repeat domain-containing protein n=1 Tax=Leucobacter iarius TaxID=333963 RepID=A0ABP4XVP8_9MICO